MIKVQLGKLIIDQNQHDSEVPKQCPVCGDKNTPDYIDHAFLRLESATSLSDSTLNYYTLYKFKCNNCGNFFFCIILFRHNFSSNKFIGEIIQTIPSLITPSAPEFLKVLSPRSLEFLKGAYYCEQNGFIELAATGYRSSMEILIKDFLIKEMGDTDPAIPRMKLANVIKKLQYFPLKNSANVVRNIGNNLTHYDNSLTPMDFVELKSFFEIVLSFIKMSYEGNHPDEKYLV